MPSRLDWAGRLNEMDPGHPPHLVVSVCPYWLSPACLVTSPAQPPPHWSGGDKVTNPRALIGLSSLGFGDTAH